MRWKNERGVTLIELMIAMAIALVMTSMLYSLFAAQARGMRQAQQSSELEDNARIAMQVLVRDIRNAGFLVRPQQALRIEDNCGATTNKVDLTSGSPDSWTVGGAASGNAINGGDFKWTTEKDGCPNGSDRLQTLIRPVNTYVQAIGGPGNSLQLDLACPPVSGGYDCMQVFTRAKITGTDCTTASVQSDPTKMCEVDDPTRCYDVKVEPKTGSGCSSCNQPICTVKVYSWDGSNTSPFSNGVHWANVGGKDSAAFNAYQSRVYQLMDLDGDGSTELVFSDTANTTFSLTAAVPGNWIPVANNIDDLQFAYQFKSEAGSSTWHQTSLWNFPNATVPAGDFDLAAKITAQDPPVAVRVTIVARSYKKEFGAGSTADAASLTGRQQIENNLPAFQAFTATGLPATGAAYCYGTEACGCGPVSSRIAYLTCTGNGNAQGFRRRVMSQIVGLRNTGAL